MDLSESLLKYLRKAIEHGDETKYSIAIGSGIDHAVLRRFLSGERDIKLQTANKIADYLKLELVQRK